MPINLILWRESIAQKKKSLVNGLCQMKKLSTMQLEILIFPLMNGINLKVS